jgi:hypothetical protein
MSYKREYTEKVIYHIVVKGNLDQKWADWFGGFETISQGDGETLLSGEVVDQATLHGVLDKINNLGLPLLLVVREGYPCLSKLCPKDGQH